MVTSAGPNDHACLDLVSINTVQELCMVDWPRYVVTYPNGKPKYFTIPDPPRHKGETKHTVVKVRIADGHVMHVYPQLMRMEELSSDPMCEVELFAYKGSLYLKPKPAQMHLLI